MATKVKEITSNPHGDAKSCSMCTDRTDRVRHDQVWAFMKQNPGTQGLRDTTRV